MDIKRILTGIIGFFITAIVLIFSNNIIFDIVIAVLAAMMLYEYNKSFKHGKANPIMWVEYICCVLIAGIHVIPYEIMKIILILIIPTFILILFLHIIITEMKKYNIIDISITLFGIAYISVLLAFVALLRGEENGKILVWYIFLSAWGTDTLAYVVGRYFGKHFFSKISPKKTIEGCVSGIIGAVLFTVIYTFFINKFLGLNINYLLIVGFSVIWSIAGQIGDFAASTIKRYTGIKDYSNLLPGHGGMLDRFDSVIFIAPFAYILLTMFI